MFHVKLDLQPSLENFTQVQQRQLRRYQELLLDRAIRIGAISKRDRDVLMERHVLDALRALHCLGTAQREVADLGSGAGLPGIPVAIVLPHVAMTLVEPRRIRAAFLELAIDLLDLRNVTLHAGPAATVGRVFDVCLARALGAPAETWNLASPLLRPGGRVVYFAGATWSSQAAGAVERAGGRCEVCLERCFQWQGPLVIMSRPRGKH
jgi:16S rRNA (guanine527-N7)-methyltransferase